MANRVWIVLGLLAAAGAEARECPHTDDAVRTFVEWKASAGLPARLRRVGGPLPLLSCSAITETTGRLLSPDDAFTFMLARGLSDVPSMPIIEIPTLEERYFRDPLLMVKEVRTADEARGIFGRFCGVTTRFILWTTPGARCIDPHAGADRPTVPPPATPFSGGGGGPFLAMPAL